MTAMRGALRGGQANASENRIVIRLAERVTLACGLRFRSGVHSMLWLRWPDSRESPEGSRTEPLSFANRSFRGTETFESQV